MPRFVQPPIPADESARQAATDDYGVLRLDPIEHPAPVEEALRLFDAKIGIATIIDLADNPLVPGDPDIRFYPGAPMVTPSGHVLGALRATDSEPRRDLSDAQFERLRQLAEQVTADMIRAAAGRAVPAGK